MPTRGYTPPRQCPVGAGLGLAQCQRYVRPGRLMCPTHWRVIPKDLQLLIYSTLRAFNRSGSDEDWGRYMEARDAALGLVAPVVAPPPSTDTAQPW